VDNSSAGRSRIGNRSAGITSSLSAGSHDLELRCSDDDGHIEIVDTRITAVTLD